MATTIDPSSAPTLFDISAIPYFPFSPGLRLWLSLGLIVLAFGVASFLAVLIARRRKVELDGASYTYDQCRAILGQRPITQDRLNLGVAFAKRALSIRERLPLTALSSHELANLELSSPTLKLVLKLLGECDRLRYQGSFDRNLSRAEGLRTELLNALSEHFKPGEDNSTLAQGEN